MADVDRCVICGEIIPEGRQVCWICESNARIGFPYLDDDTEDTNDDDVDCGGNE